MTRLTTLSAGLLALSLLSFGAAAQSTAPAPPSDANSGNDATELAKKIQNPIGDLYSFPFQNNTNFNYGPHKGTQDILNVQPVIPIHINDDWTIITRTILPLVWQPSLRRCKPCRSALARPRFRRSCRQASQSTVGYGRSGRFCRYRRSATGASAQTSGAVVRLALWFT